MAAAEDSGPLDRDGRLFELASEARRIKSAHLCQPSVRVQAVDIDPLLHQIEAVYRQVMPLLIYLCWVNALEGVWLACQKPAL